MSRNWVIKEDNDHTHSSSKCRTERLKNGYSNGSVKVLNSTWLKCCGNTSRSLCMCLSISSILNRLQSLNYCCAQFCCNNPLRLRITLYQKHAWSLISLFPIKLSFLTSYLNLIWTHFVKRYYCPYAETTGLLSLFWQLQNGYTLLY